ncbi:hypothetical protein H8B02_43505 [Bradyrhizobium sp. Pear77]|uniref:hypothetical protein n=1 Tax=Bradyrhizobium TaxID=374 RepID=UPI001E4BE450|nr:MULTISPECIES: hypothetical protein [Bradyrhizobium]MCC8960033.1 hypothetical protein [Bradyrhizobium altum]MCC8968422.1 hypothetical protein [Bradyrhizobium oropedii]
MAANAAQGALETFAGRVVEAGVRKLSRHPQSPHEVNDSAMAAHAAVNVVMGLIAGTRAGVHTWRASGNPEAYLRGFRGERSAQSAALAMAGTPDVPAGQMIRLLPSVAAAFLAFGAAAHTGIGALSHLGSSSSGKVDAYEAVVRSNANIAYCYTREVVDFVARVFQLVSHDALLTQLGWAAGTVEYSLNLAAQSWASSDIDQGRSFDLRWPAISAAAEAVDVAFISAAARLAEPDRPVEIWRGRLAEGTSGERHATSRPTVIDTIDRVTQRAVGRQLVGEVRHYVPELAVGTHLRELTWQAEHASRGGGNSTPPSDIEAPPPGGTPNAGSSSDSPTLRQEATELLPPPGHLNVPSADVAGPSSAEAVSSFVDRSLGEYGHLVDLGWEHRRDRAPPFLIGALNRKGDLPRSPLQSTKLRIHGQIYTAYLEPGSGAPTIDNPLGGNIMLAPSLELVPLGSAGAAHW